MSWSSLSCECNTGVNERYLGVKLNLSFWPIYAFFFPAKFLSELGLLLYDRVAAGRMQAADITYANLGSQGINAQLVWITTASLEQWVLSGCPHLMVQLGGSALVCTDNTLSPFRLLGPLQPQKGHCEDLLGLHGNKAEQWDAALPLLEVHVCPLHCVPCCSRRSGPRSNPAGAYTPRWSVPPRRTGWGLTHRAFPFLLEAEGAGEARRALLW